MRAEDLSQPNQFPHPISTIQWRETHISQVILTGNWVYKIKKPVNFGFLDFSTLELRKHYCEEEIRLNRRTAPELYISVEPLYCKDDDYNFCGRGELVDYAVKMRQFDPDALLLRCMPQVAMDYDFFQNLGYMLARFHEEAEVCNELSEYGDAQSVRFPVEENFRQILPRVTSEDDRAQLRKVEDWSHSQCDYLAVLFDQRKREGKIRECHGDLHLANIALIDGRAVMFDCIEFNDRFRRIDVASDLAFLLMDMTFNGYGEQANLLLNSYLEFSFDYELLQLLTFYMVYRAMVRAKVAILTMEQAAPSEQLNLLAKFRAYVKFSLECIGTPPLYLAITCGLSGSGKSTLARKLAAHSSGVRLRSDVVRKHLAGLKPLQNSSGIDPVNANALYSIDYTIKTFDQLEALSRKVLNYGYPVIVDATFLTIDSRRPFSSVAGEADAPFYIIYLDAPVKELRRRLELRQIEGRDASEADTTVMEQQLDRFEVFSDTEETCVIRFCGDVNSGTIKELIQLMTAKLLSQ